MESFKYVYEHYLYGKCFYVGMGIKSRPFQFKREGNFARSKKWWDFVGDNIKDVEVKIIGEYPLHEAKQLEKELIIKHFEEGSPLTNKMIGQGLPGSLNGMYENGGKVSGERNVMFNKLSANHKVIISENMINKEKIEFESIQKCYDYYDGIIGPRSIFKAISGINVPKINKLNLKFYYKEKQYENQN